MKYYEISKIFRGQRYAGVPASFDGDVDEEQQKADETLEEANKTQGSGAYRPFNR